MYKYNRGIFPVLRRSKKMARRDAVRRFDFNWLRAHYFAICQNSNDRQSGKFPARRQFARG